MFQTVFPSIISSSKLHIQRHAFVGPILLLTARLACCLYSANILAMHRPMNIKFNLFIFVIKKQYVYLDVGYECFSVL